MTQNPLTTAAGFSAAVDAAYAASGLADDLAFAVRGRRRVLGLSQRAYATQTTISRTLVARAEAGHAAHITVANVTRLLEDTGYVLAVVDATADIEADRPSGAVSGRDLVAKDSIGRRPPAHLRLVPASKMPPTWWWARHGGWLSKAVVPAWTYRRPE